MYRQSYQWGRSDKLSDRAAVALLGFFVVGGLVGTAIVSAITYNMQLNLWVALLFGLGLPFLGIYISASSDQWPVSLFGFGLVFLPFGALIGPFAAQYQLDSVVQVLVITLIVSTCMWIVGMMIPPIAQHWSGYIVGILLVFIAGDVARAFMPMFGVQPTVLGVWDWIVAAFFSLLIIYDVNKAMQGPKTVDAMVDGAVGIYLDIINIFVRLLAASGKKRD